MRLDKYEIKTYIEEFKEHYPQINFMDYEDDMCVRAECCMIHRLIMDCICCKKCALEFEDDEDYNPCEPEYYEHSFCSRLSTIGLK